MDWQRERVVTDCTDCPLRSEIYRQRRELRELWSIVGRLARRGGVDSRLGGVLALIYRFSHAKEWTAGELLDDARRADSDLWCALDELVGPRGDPAIRLGRWLERHDGIDCDGLRLRRVEQKNGTWLYCVEPVE